MQKNENKIRYHRHSKDVEYIYYNRTTQSYPVHTHSGHMTIGYVAEGAVCVTENGGKDVYHAGEWFCILPDVPHALEPAEEGFYSMICFCMHMDAESVSGKEAGYLQELKQMILDAPEHACSIEQMAKWIGISPYHMIRGFKKACGLTPHQFQIQCRIRKAQKLLEEGKSATEVAYETGFCDQSHFDRCFRKIVRLTPSEYKQSVNH